MVSWTDTICRSSRVCSCTQPREVARQGVFLGCLAIEHLRDLREPEPELAQQQDALQPHEGVPVVVAVAVVPVRDGGSRPMSP